MRISDEYMKYLSGELLDSGLDFPIVDGSDREDTVADRFALIEKLFSGKTVLHVGCADHPALIPQKIAAGTWTHGYLSRVSSRCVGIDINLEAIDYLRNTIGITNVMYGDIATEVPESLTQGPPWDSVFLGEIVEHLDNPVGFLQSLKRGLEGHAGEIVVTAPNAMRLENFRKLLRGTECINSDHRFWFTPYTLAKAVFEAGFRPVSFFLVTAYKLRKPTGIRSYLRYRGLLRFPGFRDTIVLKADF
jgi:2-polyprenyl-3-methyl-5-hydroxy-6-metoxy-1,4-benzoquinol methylase